MLQKIAPEEIEVANVYISCQHDIRQTAQALSVTPQRVSQLINTPSAKAYLNQLYVDSGYRNRYKLGNTLDKMIDSKLQQAMDTEVYTKADLLQLMQFAHKLRMDELKLQKDSSAPTVNIANFGQGNYGQLVEKLINGKTVK